MQINRLYRDKKKSGFHNERSDILLDLAIKYKEELQKKMLDTWFNEKYKYYYGNIWFDKLEIDSDTWNNHQFVSVDNNGEVIGFIEYHVNREDNSCSDLGICNFTEDKRVIFGMDLGQALQDIFEKYKFRKLKFSVYVGNPIEKSYDKMIKKYNGRIVGTYLKDTKCLDGEYCDRKLYEIFREDYLKSISADGGE